MSNDSYLRQLHNSIMNYVRNVNDNSYRGVYVLIGKRDFEKLNMELKVDSKGRIELGKESLVLGVTVIACDFEDGYVIGKKECLGGQP